MTQNSTIISTDVTRGHFYDSRASRVPTPLHSPKERTAGRSPGTLGRAREGAATPEEPDAARRRSARAARGMFSESDFRRLCAVMRRERAAYPHMAPEALVWHVEGLAEKAGLPCPPEASERLAAVLTSDALQQRGAARRRERMRRAWPVATTWRDRCAHSPTCTTPTQCALRGMRDA